MLKSHPILLSALEGLKSHESHIRSNSAKKVRACVMAELRDGTTESFSKFLTELNRRVFELVSSSDPNHTVGGILAIDELIDVPSEKNEKIIRFANYLRMVFSSSKRGTNSGNNSGGASDSETLRLASSALGHLARSGGSLTVDFVEFEVTRALEWLQSDRFENRRLAAVLVLKELAENAPTLFYVHVHTFFTHIWAALRDPDVEIRVCATNALSACLHLIMDRESRLRIRWYYNIYETAQEALRSGNSSADSVHGSILAIGQLLATTGDFIMPRFNEICDTIIRHKDHRDRLVKNTVVTLIPNLAEFSPFSFVGGGYLEISLNYLLSLVQKSDTRSSAFLSLGQLSVAVGKQIEKHLPKIIPLLQDGLSPSSRRGFCIQALKCVSDLAHAAGPALKVYMDDLLEQMFANGLSEGLASALSEIGTYIPSFLPLLQDRVMREISLVLSGRPYSYPGSEGFDSLFIPTRDFQANLLSHASISLMVDPSESQRRVKKLSKKELSKLRKQEKKEMSKTKKSMMMKSGLKPAANQEMKVQDPHLVVLVLRILATFDMNGMQLLPFIHDVAASYLDNSYPVIRQQAVQTCTAVMAQYTNPATSPPRGPTARLRCKVLDRVLTIAVADHEPSIRAAAIQSLRREFDADLAQAGMLRSLFIALNDEVFEIREKNDSSYW